MQKKYDDIDEDIIENHYVTIKKPQQQKVTMVLVCGGAECTFTQKDIVVKHKVLPLSMTLHNKTSAKHDITIQDESGHFLYKAETPNIHVPTVFHYALDNSKINFLSNIPLQRQPKDRTLLDEIFVPQQEKTQNSKDYFFKRFKNATEETYNEYKDMFEPLYEAGFYTKHGYQQFKKLWHFIREQHAFVAPHRGACPYILRRLLKYPENYKNLLLESIILDFDYI